MEEEIEDLRSVKPDLVSDTIDASSFTNVDAEVAAVQPPLSDADIIADLLDTEDARNGDDDGDNGAFEVEDEPVECPDRNELLKMVEMMKQFSLFTNDGEMVQSYANHVGRIIDQYFAQVKNTNNYK